MWDLHIKQHVCYICYLFVLYYHYWFFHDFTLRVEEQNTIDKIKTSILDIKCERHAAIWLHLGCEYLNKTCPWETSEKFESAKNLAKHFIFFLHM